MIEPLEGRLLLSATATPTFTLFGHGSHGAKPSATAGVAPFDPAQIRTAYGVNQIAFGSTAGTGAGETIAIVDAYNDPNIISDANSFSSQFGLPQFNGSNEPTLQVLNETGGTSLPANSSKGGWDIEEALDVEWAHSIAPNANIILFEANSASYSDLLTAVGTAAKANGVSVVSMSWGGSESSSEKGYDSTFLTPTGHQGVTFLASTGDSGSPAGYPAYSPNVIAVGGTTLSIDTAGDYLGESAWADTGGGISTVESQPSYQVGKVNGLSSTQRTVPDVSMDADPNSGVYVLDSYAGGWYQVGGTSLATPMFAGLVAIANQGRALDGQSTLNGLTQTLPDLYSLPSSDFHDVTTGSNGTYSAGPGYDLVTGLGTPVANLLVPALAGYSSTQPPSVSAPSAESLAENSTVVFSTSGGDAITLTDSQAGSNSDSLTLSVADGTLTLGSTTGLTVTGNGTSSLTVSGTLANLNSALNGLVYAPTSGFHGSDSLHLSLTDPGDSLTGTGTVALTVNAPTAPTITAPTTTITVTENTSVVFSSGKGDAITFTDAFAGSNADTLVLMVSNGTLTLATTSGVTITNGANGSSSMTVSGTVGNLNTAVNGLTYTPSANFVGSDSLKISLSDPGDSLAGSTSVGLSVASPTQPPTVTDPSAATVSENSSLTFSTSKGDAIDIADPDATSTSDSLTLTSTHGTLRLATTSGLKVTSGSNRSSSMTVTGSLTSLNAALNGLIFTPTSRYTGTATITVAVKDSTDGLSGSGTVTVTVTRVGRAVGFGGTRQAAEITNTPAQTVILERGPEGTVLFANVSDDGVTIRVSPDATSAAVGTSLTPATQPVKRTGATNEILQHGSALPTSSTSAEPSANASDSFVGDDVVQWLGLKAALEFLGF
jgi:subtilase family serine protease